MSRGFFFTQFTDMKKIAIQGTLGSFHDIAAHQYFNEEIELICCSTFQEIFDKISFDPTIIGMFAIENTIAGSLLQNNELLKESNLTINGEYRLPISHCLVCLPEEKIEDIKEIHSHPIALMQCRDFLKQHTTIKVVEAEDTAKSAEIIKEQNLKGKAAICSEYAAQKYGMKILAKGIETNKHNFTRFLVVSSSPVKKEIINKSNIVFSLSHSVGSLSKVLSILSFYNINLTKIQSLPIIGHEWEYQFYIDLTFDNYDRYKQAISAISPLTKQLKTLGEYEECKINL